MDIMLPAASTLGVTRRGSSEMNQWPYRLFTTAPPTPSGGSTLRLGSFRPPPRQHDLEDPQNPLQPLPTDHTPRFVGQLSPTNLQIYNSCRGNRPSLWPLIAEEIYNLQSQYGELIIFIPGSESSPRYRCGVCSHPTTTNPIHITLKRRWDSSSDIISHGVNQIKPWFSNCGAAFQRNRDQRRHSVKCQMCSSASSPSFSPRISLPPIPHYNDAPQEPVIPKVAATREVVQEGTIHFKNSPCSEVPKIPSRVAPGTVSITSKAGLTQPKAPGPLGQFQLCLVKPLVRFLTMPYLRAQRILQLSRTVHAFHMQSMYIARQAIHLVIILNDLVDVHEGPDDEQYQERIDLEDDLIELFDAMQEWGANPDEGLQVDYDHGFVKVAQKYAQFFRERFYFHAVRNLADDFIYGRLVAYDRKTIDFRKRQRLRTVEPVGVDMNEFTLRDEGNAGYGSEAYIESVRSSPDSNESDAPAGQEMLTLSMNESGAEETSWLQPDTPMTERHISIQESSGGNLNGSTTRDEGDVGHVSVFPNLTDGGLDRVQMLAREAVNQVYQPPATKSVGPHRSAPLFRGLPGPYHRLDAFSNPLMRSGSSSQPQSQLLPGKVIAPNTSPRLASPSSSLLPEPRPLHPVAANSNRWHPLLDNNFRELSQLKERVLLIQVLHSEWLEANEEEPQNKGRSILMGFLHRKNLQSPLSCSFDGCTRSFDRQDRALAHVRHVHLNLKPYACDGACGKHSCNDRFSSLAYRTSHISRIKTNCSMCGKVVHRQNLTRHTISCGKIK